MAKAHPVIDLHIHTKISDGTDTPEELLSRVRAAGIEVFAVTDHDAIAACERIKALLRPADPRFLFGVEFSCKDELGKYHILGYGYDPQAPSIRAVVENGHKNRLRKLGLRLERLKEDHGITFPDADVKVLFALPNPGKPHLANLMVRYGYADTIRQAFGDVLNRLHVPDLYTRPEVAIRGILDAGGVPVLAHPCFGDGDQLILGDDLKERVRRLMGSGLLGLEGYYSGYTEALREQVLSLADAFDLYVTAGSDYHGGNKLIPLADTGLSPDVPLPKGAARFLSDLLSD
jgi:predicted metal-dependent phosphoesterase TrpH